jgi:hypothetical protein
MNKLKEAFHRDVMRFGHVPGRKEQNLEGTYTGTTYANRFGSWNEALTELGYPLKKHSGRIEVSCFSCGESFKKWHYEVKDSDQDFCSHDCLHAARVEAECDICGNAFEIHYTGSNEKAYCSDQCRHESTLATFSCDNCGKKSRANKWKIARQDFVYCSKECSYEGNARSREECVQAFKDGVEVVGENANLIDVMKAGGMGHGQSYRHFDSYNQLAREAGFPKMVGHGFVDCEQCGSEVKRIRSHIEQHENHFCGKECYFEWMRTGVLRSSDTVYSIDYGPNWYVQRRAARARDDYKCRSCGMSEREHKSEYGSRLDVHHIKKARLFDDHKARNDLKNLLTLCKRCHKKWEHMGVRPQLVD